MEGLADVMRCPVILEGELCQITVQSFPELGRAAVANHPFKGGDVVLREKPLLLFPTVCAELLPQQRHAWAHVTKGAPEVLASAMAAYAAAPPAVRDRCLGMYSGPPPLSAQKLG